MTKGYDKAEGYAASLRQMAQWVDEFNENPGHYNNIGLEDIDTEELRAAAAFIDRLNSPTATLPDTNEWKRNEQRIAQAKGLIPAATLPDPFNRKQVEAICRAVCAVEGVDPDDDVFGDGCDPQWTRYADAVAAVLHSDAATLAAQGDQKLFDKTDALYESAYIAGLNLGYSLGLENNHAKLNEVIAARDGYLSALSRPDLEDTIQRCTKCGRSWAADWHSKECPHSRLAVSRPEGGCACTSLDRPHCNEPTCPVSSHDRAQGE